MSLGEWIYGLALVMVVAFVIGLVVGTLESWRHGDEPYE